jgi:hypothetical protein
MTRIAALLAVVCLLLGSVAPAAPAAFACSAGDDFNPIAESDVIVGGWVSGWTLRPDLRSAGEFTAVAVDIGVDRVFKGREVTRLQAVEANSFMPRFGTWQGGSGACGSFDADPRGLYVIVGLARGADGSLTMNRLRTFFVGDSPSGPAYEQAVARLTAPGAIVPPVTGSAGLSAAVR